MDVFLLQHIHRIDQDVEDVKLVGVYSSRAEAEAAQRRAQSRPGFANNVDGFGIDRYIVDHDEWTGGFTTIVTIHVPLEGEEFDVWRPVQAEQLGPFEYRISNSEHPPAKESWRFSPGDIVRCRPQKFADGAQGLAAYEKVAAV